MAAPRPGPESEFYSRSAAQVVGGILRTAALRRSPRAQRPTGRPAARWGAIQDHIGRAGLTRRAWPFGCDLGLGLFLAAVGDVDDLAALAIATDLAALIVAVVVAAPWARLPRVVQAGTPLACLDVVALLIKSGGGASSGFAPLVIVPSLVGTTVRRLVSAVREGAGAGEAFKTAESALDCVITMDHDGRVVEFNPAAQRTFGYQREDAVGAELAELIVPLLCARPMAGVRRGSYHRRGSGARSTARAHGDAQ